MLRGMLSKERFIRYSKKTSYYSKLQEKQIMMLMVIKIGDKAVNIKILAGYHQIICS